MYREVAGGLVLTKGGLLWGRILDEENLKRKRIYMVVLTQNPRAAPRRTNEGVGKAAEPAGVS